MSMTSIDIDKLAYAAAIDRTRYLKRQIATLKIITKSLKSKLELAKVQIKKLES